MSINGVDTTTLFATIDTVKAQPDLARFQFRATNRWILGTHSRTATAQPAELIVLCGERDALYYGKGLIADEPSH